MGIFPYNSRVYTLQLLTHMITHGIQFDAHGWTHDPTLVDEPPRYFLATSDADAHFLSMRLSVQDLPPQHPWPAAAAADDDEDFECPTAGGTGPADRW